MHNLDRILMESEPESWFGETGEQFEFNMAGESGFTEAEEMELAAQLLEISSEAELDNFLGGLFSRAVKAASNFASSPAGRALGGMLKGVAKKALPVAGSALGAYFGGPLGAKIGGNLAGMAGRAFGLEMEGMSRQEQEFEVARSFVKLAGNAAQKAAQMAGSASPAAAARTALVEAARKHAPGLLSGGGLASGAEHGGKTGRWVRFGNRVVLYGV